MAAGEYITLAIPTGSDIAMSASLKSELLAALFIHIFSNDCYATENTARPHLAQQSISASHYARKIRVTLHF